MALNKFSNFWRWQEALLTNFMLLSLGGGDVGNLQSVSVPVRFWVIFNLKRAVYLK